jgi:hypothetical protein
MSYALNFHSGKTIDCPILSRKSEDSPRTVSTDESPPRKRGANNMILAAEEYYLDSP